MDARILNPEMLKKLLRRFPLLYTAIYRILFVCSPSRLLGKLFYNTCYRGHRRNTSLLSKPGNLGFSGGIYNPGAIVNSDGSLTLLAKGQLCHWWDAVGTKADLYYQGSPVVFRLDADWATASSHSVENLAGFPELGRVGYEDFRLFRHHGETWVNHSMIPLVRKNPCVWTFEEAKPGLSRLEPDLKSLSFLGQPRLDFPVRPIEKNWVYLEHEGDLHLFYSFSRYRVLKLIERDSLRFSTVIDRQLDGRWADIGGFGTMVSFSTNPIDYDVDNWLVLVHQIEPGRRLIERCYHHWGVLVDKKSMLPHKLTDKPLFSGMGARGRKAGIVYVSSVVRHGGEFVFFMGEGDAFVTRSAIPKEYLDSLLIAP